MKCTEGGGDVDDVIENSRAGDKMIRSVNI